MHAPTHSRRRLAATAGRRRRAFRLGLLLLAAACPCAAAETAQQILDRGEALDQGPRWWNDRYQRMQLTVEKAGAAPRHVTLETYDRRQRGRQQQSLVIFVAPATKAGIALLGHTKGGAPAAQWLYMPELKRARQIAPSRRMDRFDVTDFSYHDLDVLTDLPHWKEADARSTLRAPETIDGVPCHVIDLEPRLEHVAYGRIRLWLGAEDLVARQVEFYAKRDAPGFVERFMGNDQPTDQPPVRHFRQKDIRNVGPIPVAYRIEAQSPADDSRTIIDILDVSFDRGLTDAFFSPGSLGTRSGR